MKRVILLVVLLTILISGAQAAPKAEPIYGGVYTAQGNSPVALIDNTLGKCTGTLVASNLVLTAAHCIHNLGPDYYLVDIAGDWREVAQAWKHGSHIDTPVVTEENSQYDLGMLQLKESVNIKPAQIVYNRPLVSGEFPYIFGFGQNENSHIIENFSLNNFKVAFSQISTQRNGVILTEYNSDITGLGAVCAGDSGGPLILSEFNQTLTYLIGVTSAGNAKTDIYGRCYLNGPTSIFVDLQSYTSQVFLSYFSGITYLNYYNVIVRTYSDAAMAQIKKANSAKNSKNRNKSIKSAISYLKFALVYSSGERKTQLNKTKKSVTNAQKAKSSSEIKKFLKSALNPLKKIQALGYN